MITDIKQITLMPKYTDNANVDVVQRLNTIHLIGMYANAWLRLEIILLQWSFDPREYQRPVYRFKAE